MNEADDTTNELEAAHLESERSVSPTLRLCAALIVGIGAALFAALISLILKLIQN